MEEGFVNRSIRKLKRILSSLFGKIRRSAGLKNILRKKSEIDRNLDH